MFLSRHREDVRAVLKAEAGTAAESHHDEKEVIRRLALMWKVRMSSAAAACCVIFLRSIHLPDCLSCF